jgi:hypothetical protein
MAILVNSNRPSTHSGFRNIRKSKHSLITMVDLIVITGIPVCTCFDIIIRNLLSMWPHSDTVLRFV